METITKPNKKPHKLSAWLTDPFLWLFSIILIACYIVSSRQSGEWTSDLILISCISIASLIVLFLVRRQTPTSVAVPKPALECGIMFGWYAAFMVVLSLTKAEGIFADEFAKWLWFIIMPLILLFIIRGRGTNIRTLLRSVGFHRQGIGKALLVGLLAYAVMIPSFPFMLPYAQLQKLEDLFHTPLKAVLLLPVAFLLSLLTAAFTEEIFFRGILQPRLARLIRSEMRACLITAFLFGLYHLPYPGFYPLGPPTATSPGHYRAYWSNR